MVQRDSREYQGDRPLRFCPILAPEAQKYARAFQVGPGLSL